MKNLVLQISGYVLAIGLLFFGFRAWDNIEKWNVDENPQKISTNEITDNLSVNSYVQIEGGTLDIMNAYEVSLTTKNSGSKISSNYYIPVITEEDKVAYIVKRTLAPSLSDLTTQVNASGLLLDQSEISQDMLDGFNKQYNFKTKVFLLDETFEPMSRLSRAKGLLFPLYSIIAMLLIRFFLTRQPKEKPLSNEKGSESESD